MCILTVLCSNFSKIVCRWYMLFVYMHPRFALYHSTHDPFSHRR